MIMTDYLLVFVLQMPDPLYTAMFGVIFFVSVWMKTFSETGPRLQGYS